MNKEEMIEAIYEKIADKTLSLGCRIKDENNKIYIFWNMCKSGNSFNTITLNESIERFYYPMVHNKIIGHPVMIGDVLDYIYNNMGASGKNTCPKCGKRLFIEEYDSGNENLRCIDTGNCRFSEHRDIFKRDKIVLRILGNSLKRKPIEEQSMDCIEYIYNLIK